MKRFNQTIYLVISLTTMLILSSCGTQGMLAIGSDKTLPKITQVKHIVSRSSVGFEWPAIKDSRVQGIKVYRTIPQNTKDQRYTKIASIDDRYATHYVDRDIVANQSYLYTFTTYSLLKESLPGRVISIHTGEAFEPVSFIKTYMSDMGVVKILWNPHPSPEIDGYMIERKISGGTWKYLALIKGRLMPEYIDKSAAIGYHYSYRVIARSSSGVRSLPSEISEITVK
jgi:fibronectin type 3 domain-containing protein